MKLLNPDLTYSGHLHFEMKMSHASVMQRVLEQSTASRAMGKVSGIVLY